MSQLFRRPVVRVPKTLAASVPEILPVPGEVARFVDGRERCLTQRCVRAIRRDARDVEAACDRGPAGGGTHAGGREQVGGRERARGAHDRGKAAVATVDDTEERRRRHIGRPPKAEPFRNFLSDLVTTQLLSLEVLRRARLVGHAGGKSALYALMASVRPAPTRPVVRFEWLPGEFTQHHFRHVDVRFVNGTKKRVHFFASRLTYSRHVKVTLVDNEQTETIVRTSTSSGSEACRSSPSSISPRRS